MRKTLGVLSPFIFILILFACKKSGTGASQGLSGTWAFLGMHTQTQTTSNVGGGVTLVANTTYNTKNNVGTITFSTDSMVISGLGYSVDTSYMAYFVFNNTVYDSSAQTLSLTIPPTSASAKYQVVGSDSLYFPGGGILTALDSSATQGQGSHYVIHGDSLTLTTRGVDTSGGALTVVNATIHLKRK
ncbi:MAG TPA: hypothetical protein VKQ52_09965 [Puia sp.]|nr:hypothetical protein [Puia sp.]